MAPWLHCSTVLRPTPGQGRRHSLSQRVTYADERAKACPAIRCVSNTVNSWSLRSTSSWQCWVIRALFFWPLSLLSTRNHSPASCTILSPTLGLEPPSHFGPLLSNSPTTTPETSRPLPQPHQRSSHIPNLRGPTAQGNLLFTRPFPSIVFRLRDSTLHLDCEYCAY